MIVLRNDRDYNLTRLKILQGKITSVWAGDFFFNGVHTPCPSIQLFDIKLH